MFRSMVFVGLVSTLAAGCAGTSPVRNDGLADPTAAAQQLILVVTADWDSSVGILRTFERSSTRDAWTSRGEPSAMILGRSGLAWGRGMHGEALADGPVKKEGDRRSPAGVFSLSAVYGYAPPESTAFFAMPYLQADANLECVDDPSSLYYNRLVDRTNVTAVDWKHAERMSRGGIAYTWGVVVDHNKDPRIAGAGSCIFLHVWDGPAVPTTGCTSLENADVLDIIRWLRPAAQPLLVQLPRAEFDRWQSRWHLPQP